MVIGDDRNTGLAGFSLEGCELIDTVFGSTTFATEWRKILAEDSGGGSKEIIEP